MAVPYESNNATSLEPFLFNLAQRLNTQFNSEQTVQFSTCSIFLYDSKRDAHILRASTQGTSFLGHAKIVIKKENGKIKGLTATAITSAEPVVSKGTNISQDERWSNYNASVADEFYRDHYCEYPAKQTKQLIAARIQENDESPCGVVRIVRSTSHPKSFTPEDASNLMKEIKEEASLIKTSVFLSQLIELGTHIDINDLCRKACFDFRSLLKAKGCSIFLNDEDMETPKKKVYRCYGTTGLVKTSNTETSVKINDPFNNEDAWYIYEPEVEPITSITIAAIKYRTNIFIDDIQDELSIKAALQEKWKVERIPGSGQVSEYDERSGYERSKGVLYCPMFYNDPENTFVSVLGVARVQTEKHDFNNYQRHLFVSLVENLSKAIIAARLVEFIDKLQKQKTPPDLFSLVVKNIPKFIGARDCALFLKDESFLRMIASWKKGDLSTTEEISKSYYDLSKTNDPVQLGYTGWVGAYGKILIFNDPEELIKKYGPGSGNKNPLPVHNTNSLDDYTFRYLGIPIGEEKNVLAVLRLCKSKDEACLTDEDARVLDVIARRLQPYIEKLNQDKAQLNNIFSQELQIKIKNLKDDILRKMLSSFFDNFNTSNTVESLIISYIEQISFEYNSASVSVNLFKDFSTFNDKILNKIPNYRDHFIHQFTVYLLGVVIIDALDDEFYTNYCSAYLSPDQYTKGQVITPQQKKQANLAWLYTSLFHDMGYPLQAINSWIKKIIDTFSGGRTQNVNLSPLIQNIYFTSEHLENIHKLAEFHTKVFTGCPDNKHFDKIIECLHPDNADQNIDHGVIGALRQLSDIRLDQEFILPCASAIALHNRLIKQYPVASLSFERHPLACLLIYCDLIHEWNRSQNSPLQNNGPSMKLESLKVYQSNEINIQLQNKLKISCDVTAIKNICFSHVANCESYKIDEAKIFLGKIRSTSVLFVTMIDARSICSNKG